MQTELIDAVERKSLRKNIPRFDVGDVIEVYYTIKEGDKVRTQIFSGTVIARRGRGLNKMFTVRRIVNDEGVERIFPLHSPAIVDIKPIRSGKTRRAKLYYLRKRTGKATKLTHRLSEHTGVGEAVSKKQVAPK